MTAPPALQMLAVGRGGWSFAIVYVDASGNPVDLTATGLTPVAQFYQGNTGTTTNLAVTTTQATSGQATAVVPEDVVLSTLYPAPPSRLLGGLLSMQPAAVFRLYAYVIDALGNRIAEQVLAIQPVDWRTADFAGLPQPPVTYAVVGPSGPQGATGVQGLKGDPGGITPHTGTAATVIANEQVIRLTPSGLAPASSADATQAGTVVGIATVAASSGQAVTYMDGGTIADAAWTWIPGPIFFDNAGALTQSPPTGGYVQRVGRALTATVIAVQLAEPIVIVPGP